MNRFLRLISNFALGMVVNAERPKGRELPQDCYPVLAYWTIQIIMRNGILKSTKWSSKHIHQRNAENTSCDLGAFESVLYIK